MCIRDRLTIWLNASYRILLRFVRSKQTVCKQVSSDFEKTHFTLKKEFSVLYDVLSTGVLMSHA